MRKVVVAIVAILVVMLIVAVSFYALATPSETPSRRVILTADDMPWTGRSQTFLRPPDLPKDDVPIYNDTIDMTQSYITLAGNISYNWAVDIVVLHYASNDTAMMYFEQVRDTWFNASFDENVTIENISIGQSGFIVLGYPDRTFTWEGPDYYAIFNGTWIKFVQGPYLVTMTFGWRIHDIEWTKADALSLAQMQVNKIIALS